MMKGLEKMIADVNKKIANNKQLVNKVKENTKSTEIEKQDTQCYRFTDYCYS